MISALILFAVNGLNYCLLVLNYRAVAQGSIPRTAITDGLIAAAGFTLIGHVAAAPRSALGHVAYVLGGVIGSVVALLLSRRLEAEQPNSSNVSADPPPQRHPDHVESSRVRFEYADGRSWEVDARAIQLQFRGRQ